MKCHRLPQAAEMLERAKELNPKHLPLCNEPGSVYTFLGQYEKADEQFHQALKEERYPNYRHQTITYQFMTRNCFRWADAFRQRRDSTNQLVMLERAYQTAQKGCEVAGRDFRMWGEYRQAARDLGIALAQTQGFDAVLVPRQRPPLEHSRRWDAT